MLKYSSSCVKAFFFILLLSVAAHSASSQGLTVAPSRIFFKTPGGIPSTEWLTLHNTGTETMVLKASLRDWYRDSLGEKQYLSPGSTPNSNAAQVTVLPDLIEIPPNGRAEVAVTVSPPADSRSVTNSMLFFTQVNEQKGFRMNENGVRVGVNIRLEMGIHVYNTPPNALNKAVDIVSFKDLGLKKTDKDSLRRMVVTLHNTGNVVTDGQVRFELTDMDSGAEEQLPVRSVSMLPGAVQSLNYDVPAKPGRFMAVALLDCGPDVDLKVAEKELQYGQ